MTLKYITILDFLVGSAIKLWSNVNEICFSAAF